VYVAGGTVSFTSATLSGNEAAGGTAGYSTPQGGPTYGEGNGGTGYGGALDVAAGTVSLTGVLVSNNTVRGGYRWNGFNVSVNWCVPNKPPPLPNGYGGGMYVAGGSVTLSSDTVENNTALGGYGAFAPVRGYGDGFGGGICIASGATATLCSETVQSNSASGPTSSSGSDGGGIYIASGATAYLDSFTVANTINNTDGSGTNGSTANIVGPYIVQNC
jgi:hypothetical protein